MLLDLNLNELTKHITNLGFEKFRAKQIYDALISAKELNEVTNLPKNIKEAIKDEYPQTKIVKALTGKDGTQKFVFEFFDKSYVEGVLMSYKYGYTLCISTQVGCRMGCKFCASGLNGLKRNLSAGEILSEVLLVNRLLGGGKDRKITNIVLMGSGEPLDNYDEVTKFIRLINDPNSLNISQRNISLSTCGIVPNIYRLADDGFSVTLTISLHAPNDEIRQKTMPIAKVYSIDEILAAAKYYFNKTGRRVVFEYTLVKGVNDKDEHARELALRLKNLTAHVNIIPLNYVKERGLVGSNVKRAHEFKDILTGLFVSATVRRTLGEDIGGACGQLIAGYTKSGELPPQS